MSNTSQAATTIVVVDDEPIALEFCRATLTRAGYRVLTAASGDEALSWFQTGRSSVALALLDILMPGMTGPALAQRIVELRPETRIVLMSGYAPDEVKRIVGNDAAHYRSMWKPFEAETLVQMILNVLGEPPPQPTAKRARS
jgi:two-component system cell cycle sensor histidine kinase/response regulator CckA